MGLKSNATNTTNTSVEYDDNSNVTSHNNNNNVSNTHILTIHAAAILAQVGHQAFWTCWTSSFLDTEGYMLDIKP